MMHVVNLLCGYTRTKRINRQRLGIMMVHEPGGSSTKALLQWMQWFRCGQISHFDYGRLENIKRYGTEKAPA